MRRRRKKSQNVDEATKKYANTYLQAGKERNIRVLERERRVERTTLEKKEEQEAGKIAISDLLLGGRAFFIWY
jgi:hypothetical protein